MQIPYILDVDIIDSVENASEISKGGCLLPDAGFRCEFEIDF
jgi:hypothetical protein